jgi:putative transposase
MKPTRRLSPVGTYFTTSIVAERRGHFRNQRYARLFIDVLYDYRHQGKYLLHDFVVMPEHVHLIITPALDVTIERAMQFIKGGYSARVGKETDWKLLVWQRGFTDHRIRDHVDLLRHRDYVRQNPVKRGLVSNAQEYQWSSAFPGYELDPCGEELTSAAKAGLMLLLRHG